MKFFQRLVLNHINANIPIDMDNNHFKYWGNRLMEDIPCPTWSITTHFDILFVNFKSTFNTIVPHKLVNKFCSLGLIPTLYSWILDFLINRPLNVRLRNCTSTTLTLNKGTPQGCVLMSVILLYSHLTVHPSNLPLNTFMKFADDTTWDYYMKTRGHTKGNRFNSGSSGV